MRHVPLPTFVLTLAAFSVLTGCGGGDVATTADDPAEMTPEEVEYERNLAKPEGSR